MTAWIIFYKTSETEKVWSEGAKMSSLASNRRGISPLIATILLLAFAVALAVMAVSYLLRFANVEPCDQTVLVLDGGETACHTDGNAQFIVANAGKQEIVGGKLSFISLRNELTEAQITLQVSPGSKASLTVPYQTINPEGTTVVVTPKILVNGAEQYCVASELRAPLKVC
jgi:flagellin-like protein